MMETRLQQMEDLARRGTDRLARIGAYALAVMMVLTFCDVIGRYFFNAPIVGTVEVTELLMGLIIYTGIGMTTLARGHIQVDIVVTHLPAKVRAGVEVVIYAGTIAFSLLIFWQLWLKAIDTFEANDLTQVWFLPVWPVAILMAFCSLMVSLGMFFLMAESSLVFLRNKDS